MAKKFFVPKFITIEDKLAGLLTFKQLFALLGAFLLSFFVFRINQFLGLITTLIAFGSAILLTFVYVNGKPFLYILPRFFDFVFGSKRYTWQVIKKITYEEITLPPEVTEEIALPTIKSRKRLFGKKVEITLEYPGNIFNEKIELSLDKPIASQLDNLDQLTHKHTINPKNPYRLFPYVKLYKSLK
jgi:hypothetical protein